MSKVRLYASFLAEFKSRRRDARQTYAAIEHFGRTLKSLSCGAAVPREVPTREMDADNELDRQRMKTLRARAQRDAAYDFETVDEAMAFLKKECGLAH